MPGFCEPDAPHHTLNPRFIAAVKLLERTGMSSFRIGHSDEGEDGVPVIWHATAEYRRKHGIAFSRHYFVDAAIEPVEATLKLCASVVDGGLCTHCGALTVFVPDTNTNIVDLLGCVYAWDPELATYRRGCEGDG